MPDMRLFKSKNTKLEWAIRRPLFARGFRYRLHTSNLPGKPDLFFPKFNAVIFIHGCFWHGHADCPISHIPNKNPSFWVEKIAKNKRRDSRNQELISSQGIRILIVWECALKRKDIDFIDFIDYIDDWIRGGVKSTQMTANEPMPTFQFKK